ncbi:MAG: hypothetical protein QOH48_602 [Actinomycetota bacterium]|nr:hypothetical protein [Actinomycetota bacterium]
MILLVGAAPAGGSVTSPDKGRAGIERMLKIRSEAVMAGDKHAFMTTVAPGAHAFQQRQARLFDYMRKVPFHSYRLFANWTRYGDLAGASVRTRYPRAQKVAIPVTEERYAISGFDRAPIEDDLFYTFVEMQGRWFVASDSDTNSIGLETTRHLWDFGPVVARSSRHFLLLTHPCSGSPGCPHLPSDILAIAESALARVDRYWREPWPHKIVILAPTTTAELHRMLQATFDVNKFVAFAYASEDPEHGLRFIGRRIILNWQAIAGRTTDSLLTILSHELTHVATRGSAGPEIPTFIEEGIAEYVGYNADPASLSYLHSVIGAGRFDGKLPLDYQFTTGTGRDIYLSYQKAESAVRFFIDRWGLTRFVRFYRSLGRQRVVAGTPRFHLDQALRRTIGMGFLRFQKQWASSLRG